MNKKILSIETSCDDTCICISDLNMNILSSAVYNQSFIHAKFNGIIPELASKYHSVKILEVFDDVFNKTKLKTSDISYIAVTYGPGLINSLSIGINFAKNLCLLYSIPIIKINHLEGHIFSGIKEKIQFPFISLVISGGNTVIYLSEKLFSYELIGFSLDEAVGESLDKLASIMGLKYPGGVSIDNIVSSRNYFKLYKFPSILNTKDNFNFSFSGYKTFVSSFIKNSDIFFDKIFLGDICYSIQYYIFNSIIKKTINSCLKFKIKNLYIGGGVACNSYFRKKILEESIKNNINLFIADKELCSDNAIMISKVAVFKIKKKVFDDFSFIPEPNAKL